MNRKGGLASKNGRVGKCVDLHLSFCWDLLWDCVRNASAHQSALARAPKAGFGLCSPALERTRFFYPIHLSPTAPCSTVSAVAGSSGSKLTF